MMSRQKSISKRTAIWPAFQRLVFGEDGTAGAVLVEATIIAPILVVMSIYVAGFGLLFYNKMVVQNAAQAGAQWAIANRTYNCSSIHAAASQNATLIPPSPVSPTSRQFCGCSTDASGNQIVTWGNQIVTPVGNPSPPNFCTPATCTSAPSSCSVACTSAPNTPCNTGGVLGNYVTVTAAPTNTYQSFIAFGLLSGTPNSTPNISATTTARIQ